MPTLPLRTPPTRDFPTIRRSLAVYRVFAYATGSFLLLVCAEVVLRWILNTEIVLGGPLGAVAFVEPKQADAAGGFNLSVAVLMFHGYLFMAYLITDFVLVTVMRYPITRFLVIAAGGIVPLLSFVMERRVHAEVEGYLRTRERQAATA